ncbi:Multimeric flavodoxin WrbA [Ruminococcus sp. YE71]|uniref:flavodoxin family protein n=1 Tax=unclassified Ruminococcus TaxID=2608920 RepID=UPI00088B6C37|nr:MULTISPECIES: flavodoxin family protein [unclassified Ruminococcus]SDA30433.1 Multimeric flavodoxin WrbA [Ruminococcus sp. YE78]SFW49615.1 Multimeric flavodoxin WrbA [Ruminococcus sp. YE71]
MKTLILNGSPRKNGDTAALVSQLAAQLKGEVRVIDCCSDNISPCSDCRACRTLPCCPVNDGMQEIYTALSECENVVIASPVHYAELSAGLLKAAGRFQVYSSALIFRHEALPTAAKRGAIILAQGGSGGAERAFETAKLIFMSIGIKDVLPPVISPNTDRLAAADDPQAAEAVGRLAAALSE